MLECAGSINTPAILERSGIGNKTVLDKLSIPVIVNNPHVGEHLQNQYGTKTTIMSSATNKNNENFGIAGFQVYTDLYPVYLPEGIRRNQMIVNPEQNSNITDIMNIILQPKSLGRTHIINASYLICANISLSFYEDEDDLNQILAFYDILKRIPEIKLVMPSVDVVNDREKLTAYCKSVTGIMLTYHATGTARMSKSIETCVVDSRLSVFGVENLYIADNSICPICEDGNTGYSAYIIGLVASYILQNLT